MMKRIAAIAFIFICTSIAWAVLGSTIFYRTYSLDSELRNRVASSWGAPQEQAPPTAGYMVVTPKQVMVMEDGMQVVRTTEDRTFVSLPLEKSRVNAALHLDYRRKGLLWFSTYQVRFNGAYEFLNSSEKPQDVILTFHFPADQAIYDDLIFSVNGRNRRFLM